MHFGIKTKPRNYSWDKHFTLFTLNRGIGMKMTTPNLKTRMELPWRVNPLIYWRILNKNLAPHLPTIKHWWNDTIWLYYTITETPRIETLLHHTSHLYSSSLRGNTWNNNRWAHSRIINDTWKTQRTVGMMFDWHTSQFKTFQSQGCSEWRSLNAWWKVPASRIQEYS